MAESGFGQRPRRLVCCPGVCFAYSRRTPAERHRVLTWAQRLKRVFGIEIATCETCGGKVKVIASIEDPAVIGKILGHRASRELPAGSRPPSRGPPQGELGFP